MSAGEEALSPVVSATLASLPAVEPASLDCLERTIWRLAGHGGLATRSLLAAWVVDPARIAVVLRERDGACLGYLSPPAEDGTADEEFAERLLTLDASACTFERAGIGWNADPQGVELPWRDEVWGPGSPLTYPDQVVLPWRAVSVLSADPMMRRIEQMEGTSLAETTVAHSILFPVGPTEGNTRIIAAWTISADMWFILRARKYEPQRTGVPGEPDELPPGLEDHIWQDQQYLLHATPWELMNPQLPHQGYDVFDRDWLRWMNDYWGEDDDSHYGIVQKRNGGPAIPVEGFYGLDETWLPPPNRPFLAAVRQAIASPQLH